MSELGALKPDPGMPAPATAQAPTPAPPPHMARRIAAWVLVVLFGLLTPITIVSGWAVKTVTNTDRYVATMQPLAKDPVITNYVADKATTALFSQLGVQQRIAAALPRPAQFIAAPVTQQLESFTQKQLQKATSSQTFQNLWERENRFTHATAVSILSGTNPPPSTTGRKLVVELTPILTKAIDELDARGVTVFNPIKSHLQTNRLLSLQLVSQEQLSKARSFFSLAISLRWILLIATPLVGIAAILIGVERRRTALRVALAGVLACLALAAGLTLGRVYFMGHAGPVTPLVAQHIFDAIMHFLHRTLYWTLAVFALLAVIMWVVGDSTWAVALRRSVRRGTEQIGEGAEQLAKSEAVAKAIVKLHAAARFVARTQPPLRWAGVVIAALFILFSRTAGAIVWSLVLLGAYQILISLIAWWATKEPSSPELPAGDEEHAAIG